LEDNRIISDEQIVETKKEKRTYNFATFFRDFTKNNFNQFHVCTRYVRPSNLSVDSERHWFFVYLSLFVDIEKRGNIYLCRKRAWIENPLKNNNQYTYDAINERRSCRDRDLDLSFNNALLRIEGM